MKAVMDTNVLVAAFRSRRGASFEILRRLFAREWKAVISNHLLFEYEEVLKRVVPKLGFSIRDADEILNAICACAEEHTLSHVWQPVLPDPDDEPLVQLAKESDANTIVTHNVRHVGPAKTLGIVVLKPAEFLARLKQR